MTAAGSRHDDKGAATPSISRRRFVQFGGLAALTVALPAGIFGCRSEKGDEIFRSERTITDQANRTLTIPTPNAIERVYFTSPLGQVFIFSLAPELQAGTGISFTKQELAYLPEGMGNLPNMGSLSGNGEIDREELIARGVQIVFSISGTDIAASSISEADKLQDQTGIPVVLVDGSFARIADAYRFLGDVLGLEERAEKLAVFLENIYADVTAAVGDLEESEKVRVYYAEGPLGLQTEPDASQHALAFAVAGANNVAAVEANQGLGMSNVSLEQVIAWQPEVIVAWDDVIRGGADEIIRTKDTWAATPAAASGRVYTMPNVPFAWLDRPPGVNRFIGIQWLANMLYPDLYDVDMVEETQKFYSTMYWRDITVDQALSILGNSYPPLGKTAKYTSSGTQDATTDTDTGLTSNEMSERMGGVD